MATAWENLVADSSAPNGSDAWTHLISQNVGGGGGPTQLVVIEAAIDALGADINVTADASAVDVEVDGVATEIAVDEGVTT